MPFKAEQPKWGAVLIHGACALTASRTVFLAPLLRPLRPGAIACKIPGDLCPKASPMFSPLASVAQRLSAHSKLAFDGRCPFSAGTRYPPNAALLLRAVLLKAPTAASKIPRAAIKKAAIRNKPVGLCPWRF